MSTTLPTLGITMGNPAGIGAEVIVKALADPEIRKLAKFVIFGHNELMAYAADLAEIEAILVAGNQHERLRPYDHDVVVLDYDDFTVLGLDGRVRTAPAAFLPCSLSSTPPRPASKRKSTPWSPHPSARKAGSLPATTAGPATLSCWPKKPKPNATP